MMIPINTMPRPCTTGTLKIHPYERIEGTQEYRPRRKEFIPGRKGLLWGFGVEGECGEGGELSVSGLVEFDDGSFDTFAVSCIRLDDPTPQNK